VWNFRLLALHAQGSVGGAFACGRGLKTGAKIIEFIVKALDLLDERSAISLGALSGSRSNPFRTIGNRMP
jgi:hypothetical protein